MTGALSFDDGEEGGRAVGVAASSLCGDPQRATALRRLPLGVAVIPAHARHLSMEWPALAPGWAMSVVRFSFKVRRRDRAPKAFVGFGNASPDVYCGGGLVS
jgi:hypothetical protein